MSEEDVVIVYRLIRYEGRRSWIEQTLARSVKGRKHVNNIDHITATTLNEFPEVMRRLSEEQEEGKEDS